MIVLVVPINESMNIEHDSVGIIILMP